MTEYDELLKKLIELRPEITLDIIKEKIRVKKEKIGAGYLTDSGALFLIASDMGLDIEAPQKIEMGLKDLYAGAKEITLEAKVLSISPVRELTRKDGTPLHLRTMTIYDKDTTGTVKMWDDKATQPEIDNFKSGDPIKIVNAYTKTDMTGALTINLGTNSSTMRHPDAESTIPSIDSITKKIEELQDGDKNVVVKGIFDGRLFGMEFTNSKGMPGKALKLNLKGSSGTSIPIVLWGKDESAVPDMIEESAEVRLIGIKVKNGNQGLEIHGDDATTIDIKGGEINPLVVRIVATHASQDTINRTMLGINSKGTLYNITDTSNMTSTFKDGDVVECMPSKIRGTAVSLDVNSFVRKVEDDNTVPDMSKILVKINQIKPDKMYCVEAIILKAAEKREVQTKSGQSITLSETLVGDDTGQIAVKGWRDNASILDECNLGDIVAISALNAKIGFMGEAELVLTSFSTIKKKNKPKNSQA